MFFAFFFLQFFVKKIKIFFQLYKTFIKKIMFNKRIISFFLLYLEAIDKAQDCDYE